MKTKYHKLCPWTHKLSMNAQDHKLCPWNHKTTSCVHEHAWSIAFCENTRPTAFHEHTSCPWTHKTTSCVHEHTRPKAVHEHTRLQADHKNTRPQAASMNTQDHKLSMNTQDHPQEHHVVQNAVLPNLSRFRPNLQPSWPFRPFLSCNGVNVRYPVPEWLLFLDSCGEWFSTDCVVSFS